MIQFDEHILQMGGSTTNQTMFQNISVTFSKHQTGTSANPKAQRESFVFQPSRLSGANMANYKDRTSAGWSPRKVV